MTLKRKNQITIDDYDSGFYETSIIPIEKITVKRPELRVHSVDPELLESIKTIGLMNPLIVTEAFELIAGGRRYTACKELDMKNVTVRVFKISNNQSDVKQNLAHLDENLIRRNLDGIEFDRAMAERKKLYEEIYPSTKKGGDRKSAVAKIKSQNPSADSFVEDTAKKTGKSKTTVKDSIRRAENASEAVNKAREEGHLNDSKANLLVGLAPKDQDKLLELAISLPVNDLKQVLRLAKEFELNALISEINHGSYLKTFAVISASDQLIKDSEELISGALGVSRSAAKMLDLKEKELMVCIDTLSGYIADQMQRTKSKPIPVDDDGEENE